MGSLELFCAFLAGSTMVEGTRFLSGLKPPELAWLQELGTQSREALERGRERERGREKSQRKNENKSRNH